MTVANGKWDTNYEWKVVTLLGIGFGLVGLDRWIIAPLGPTMAVDLGLSPGDIGYLVGALGCVGEDGDLVADDLHEAAADGDEALLAVLDDADLPRRERRKKRRMTRQDSQLPVNSGSDEPVDLFGRHQPLRGDYVQSHGSQ